MGKAKTRAGGLLQDPPFVQTLFNHTASSWLWLLVRLWVGYQWIEASLSKLHNPAWVVTGQTIRNSWQRAVAIPATGRPPIAFDWYRSFIQWLLDANAHTWFGPLVAYAELTVGIALVLGAFTGIAAFVGAFMNWNFMMSGSASINPVLFPLAVLLMLAWKVSGRIGADFFLLSWLGTPWKAQSVGASVGRSPDPAEIP